MYLLHRRRVWFENYMNKWFWIKKKEDELLLIDILPFLEQKNKLKSKSLSLNEWNYMRHLIVYQIKDDKDDEYYLRKQSDDFKF
uniref:Uncharacterized protein n=1 Tax=Oxytricha trifallax TaxID=1172189 RepID=G9HRB7_9SPIT|nr:hypothetical protein [Oxytricha trifallax]